MSRTAVNLPVLFSVPVALILLVSATAANATDPDFTDRRAPSLKRGLTETNLPVLINPAEDLTAKPVSPNESDSWYIAGHITVGGRPYGYLVHYLSIGDAALGVSGSWVSITDETTGWYTRSGVALPPRTGLSDTPGVDIRTENITWTGDATHMKLRAKVPEGQINLSLRPNGRVLYNMGTGYFPMFGEADYPSHQYAFPAIETSGTLTLNGRTESVSGQSWLDRQWGAMPDLFSTHPPSWAWMDVTLSNGNKISLWSTMYNSENTWATILNPDGTHTIAEATLTPDVASLWTSPDSGMTYPTRWKVTIPGLHAELNVTVTVDNQELLAVQPHYEGSATVTGSYEGRPITGHTYVEMTGAR